MPSRTVISAALGIGAALYSYGLLTTYLTNMSEYEATRLASFERYLSVYLTGYSMVAIAFLTQTRHRDASLLALTVVLAFLARVAPEAAFDLVRMGSPGGNPTRADVQARIEPFLSSIDPGGRVYILWDGSNGYEYFMTKFELMPRRVNDACWAVSTMATDDMYRCVMTPSQFGEELRSYDYLYVANPSATLSSEYASIFTEEISGPALFRVKPANFGAVELERLLEQ